MKKNLLKSMLFAMVMGFATSAWAQTVLYERGGEGTAWSAADISETEWNGSGGTLEILGGIGGLKYTSPDNGEGMFERAIPTKENSKITVYAKWRAGSSTGRAGNMNRLCFGDVEIRAYGQDQKATIYAGGTEVDLGAAKNDVRNDNDYWYINLTIDKAANTVEYSIEKPTTGKAEGTASAASIDFQKIGMGFKRGGRTNTSNHSLMEVKVSEEEQVVQTADYTVKFVDEDDNEIRETSTRSGVVGGKISLTSDDTNDFYLADGSMKYIFVESNIEGATIAEDGSTVIIVKFRKAAKYHWTAKSNVGTLQESGETWEKDQASVKYPLYQLIDGTLWTKAAINQTFAQNFDVTEDNMEFEIVYTETEITDVVFYAEMEDVEGMAIFDAGNASARSSQRAVGYSASGNTKFTKLEYGKYKMTAAFYSPTSAGGQYTFYAGDRVIWEAQTENVNSVVLVCEDIVIPSDVDILLGQGGSTRAVDYVFIQYVGDPTDEEVEAAEAAAELATAKAELQAAINDAKAAVEEGTVGVESKAKADNPEITDEELAQKVAEFNSTINEAIAEAEAALVKEGATVEELNEAASVLKLATEAYQEKVATGISEVKTAARENNAIYNLAGQRVAKAQKGLYIINGNKVVVK